MEVLGFLSQVSLFSDISRDPLALEAFASQMQHRRFRPGEAILTEGETGSELFLLLEGQASVFKKTSEGDEYKVALLKSESRPFFGEGGLLDTEARSATIRADSEVECLVLSKAAFEHLCLQRPDWALPVVLRIARAVMARLRKTNTDLSLLYRALVSEIRGEYLTGPEER